MRIAAEYTEAASRPSDNEQDRLLKLYAERRKAKQAAAKKAAKPERRITLIQPTNAAGKSGVLQITVGKETDHYFVDAAPAGFALEKCNFDGKDCTYHVNLNGAQSTCNCKGFSRHGHCKHADGLAALKRAGKV